MSLGKRAILAAVSVNLMGVLPVFLNGAMSVQIGRTFSLNPATIGALGSLFALASMLGSAPLGGLVGRLGVRASLCTSSWAAAVSLSVAALAPSPWVLAVALLVGGAANALGQPAGNALVAATVRPQRFGLGFGIKQSAIPVATLLGGLAVPALALTVGWRWAFALGAALAAVAPVLVPANRPAPRGRSESSIPPASRGPLWLLAAGSIGGVFAATSIGTLGAAGAVAAGMQEATAGFLVAAGGTAGLALRLLSGLAADRRHFDSLLGVAVMLVIGAVGWSAMSTGNLAAFVSGLIVANAFGWGWPGLQHLAIARRFPTSTAAASGVAQTGVAAGLLLGPAVLGAVATHWGWTATWLLAALSATVGAALVTLAARRLPPTAVQDRDPTVPGP